MANLIGRKAPDFTAQAVVNGSEIKEVKLSDSNGKYRLLFFYPKDFTFVCPTELHAFQEKLEEFKSRNVEVMAVSTDTEMSHWGWLQVPRNEGGIKGVTYTLVADTNKTITEDYDVMAGDYDFDEDGEPVVVGELIALRGLFLIDKDGIVRHQLINDLPLGRSVDEAIRVVDALQHFEQHGEVCPANWNKGDKAMNATHESTAAYLAK